MSLLRESPPNWIFELDDIKWAKCGSITIDLNHFLNHILESSNIALVNVIGVWESLLFQFEALQILHSGVAAQLSGCGNQDLLDRMTCQLYVSLLIKGLVGRCHHGYFKLNQIDFACPLCEYQGHIIFGPLHGEDAGQIAASCSLDSFCFARGEEWIWMENHDMSRTCRSYN